MTNDEIDDQYMSDVASGKVKFESGSPEALTLSVLQSAGKALVAAKAKKKQGQQMMAEGHMEGIAAEAERTAAAKILTRLYRASLPGK